jgi:hypothetical protein
MQTKRQMRKYFSVRGYAPEDKAINGVSSKSIFRDEGGAVLEYLPYTTIFYVVTTYLLYGHTKGLVASDMLRIERRAQIPNCLVGPLWCSARPVPFPVPRPAGSHCKSRTFEA